MDSAPPRSRRRNEIDEFVTERASDMDRTMEGTEMTHIRRRSDSVQPSSHDRPRPPPMRTMSEASVYRANSRQRISVKSGYTQNNKTLDRLMECFWTCSPGCSQTS